MYLFMSILLKFGPFHLENESRNKKKKKNLYKHTEIDSPVENH